MRLYWIKILERDLALASLRLGVGVTASDEREAIQIATSVLTELGLVNGGGFQGASIKALDSLDELDPQHVRPNMGNHLKRGVWFPMLKSDVWKD